LHLSNYHAKIILLYKGEYNADSATYLERITMLELNLLFQDNMILQRNKRIPLSGKTVAQSNVTISMYQCTATEESLLYETSVTTDNDGRFIAQIDPQPAGENYQIQVTAGNDSLTIHNVAFGDIYLACGQSNMEFYLRYESQWDKTQRLAAENPSQGRIRMFNVPRLAYEGQTRPEQGWGHWFMEDGPELEVFSSIGYYFAQEMLATQNVPIGIIGCNWGGTSCSAWIPTSCFENTPLQLYLQEYETACNMLSPEELKAQSLAGWAFEDSPEKDLGFGPAMYGLDYEDQLKMMHSGALPPMTPMGPYSANRPGGLYENMLLRIAGFPCSGILWYQGESDSDPMHAHMYDLLLRTLILQWRKDWNDEIPFFVVQLAPFGRWLAVANTDYSVIRSCQQKVADTLPKVYLASIMDLGSYYDIHPKKKKEIARRLSLLARSNIYNEDVLCDAPRLTNGTRLDETHLVLNYSGGTTLTQCGYSNDIRVQINGKQVLLSDCTINGMQLILTVPELATAESGSIVIADVGTADYGELHIQNEAGLCIRPGRIKITIS